MPEPYVSPISFLVRGERMRKVITSAVHGVDYYLESLETRRSPLPAAIPWSSTKPPTPTLSSSATAAMSAPPPQTKSASPKAPRHSSKSTNQTRESTANPIQTKASTAKKMICSLKSTYPPCSASVSAPSSSSSGSSPPRRASASLSFL